MIKNVVKTHQRDVFEIIKRTVDKTVDLIRPTYGPASNKSIISKSTHKIVVDDGVQIARDLEFEDPAENAVLNVIREVAVRTNDRVGDGTTSSLIMLQAIINEVAKSPRINGRKVEAELRRGFEEVKEQLTKQARKIKTKEDLLKVARISFDNPKIAEIIADTCFKLGQDGVVTVDRSNTMDTYVEVAEGVTLDSGYISPYMVTNPSRMETVFEKPYILFTDFRLTEAADIIPAMEAMVKAGAQNLVIIAENVEQNALATLVTNLRHVINPQTGKPGALATVAITAPKGDNRLVTLEDMAIMTGGRVFSVSKGDKLENATIADFGRADKFIARRDSSVIVGPKGKKTEIQKAINDLKSAIEKETKEKVKKDLEARVARFGSRVAVIKVGAATENEERALKYKVEDAVNATQVAFRGGVVCGSGLALARAITSSELLSEALKYPNKQLRDNMGIDESPKLGNNEAMNVVTGKTGNYFDVGVIDPVDVLIAGVESAVSIASLLCTTSSILVEHQVETKE